MDEFSQKIVLAVVAFLLGLLAEAIKRMFQREKRQVAYSVTHKPILALSETLPPEVSSKLPAAPPGNVSEYIVSATNTGNLQVRDANLLIVPNRTCTLLLQDIVTKPAREVPYGPVENPSPGEVRYPQITLEKEQSIRVRLFLLSKNTPSINVFWSGGGEKVEFRQSTDQLSGDVPFHLREIIKNYILAEIAVGLFVGFGYLAGSVVPFDMHGGRTQMTGLGVGQVLGVITRLYFLMRIVPHAVALVEQLRTSKATGGP
jgi:hypothetical protein